MSKIRKTIAVNMARSASTIPHVTNFDDADITELERIRKGSMADYVGTDLKLTMMAFVMKAVAQSLKLHPMLNASLDMEAGQIIYKDYVNIGVAVDTDRGLVVPVVRDVDQLSIPQIAAGAGRSHRQGPQQPVRDRRPARRHVHDQQPGSDRRHVFHADHQPPGSGRAAGGPLAEAARGDRRARSKSRLMMPLSLSYDHRLVDGAAAARFLNEVINYLQVPGRLWLSP